MKNEIVISCVILLCCVVYIQVEAKPAQEAEMETLTETEKVPEEQQQYWPELDESDSMGPKTEQVFCLPRQLAVGDEINVTSVFLDNPNRMSLSLIAVNASNKPDKNNIAGNITLDISNDTTKLKTVVNGKLESIEPDHPDASKPTNILGEDNPSIIIKIERNESTNKLKIGFEVGLSVVKVIELKHDIAKIKYLTLDGDVKVSSLQFKFA